MTRTLAVASVLAGALLTATPARAASCSLVVWPIAFGTYNVFATAPTDTDASVSFNCTASVSIIITLSAGNASSLVRCNTGCSPTQLSYNLYLDAARTVIWGDQSHWSVYSNAHPPAGTWVYVQAYGRIPAGQDVAAGSYTDSVVVTVIY